MTTAIDTNIISALWNDDDVLNRKAQGSFDSALSSGKLVISGLVYAELLAAPGRTDGFLDKFCEAAGIGGEWELSELVRKAAGHAYQNHATPRKRQTDQAPRRILADFLIGAHALVNGYRLLTLDAGTYRLSFPKLQLAEI